MFREQLVCSVLRFNEEAAYFLINQLLCRFSVGARLTGQLSTRVSKTVRTVADRSQ
jgi:hypothetical protein